MPVFAHGYREDCPEDVHRFDKSIISVITSEGSWRIVSYAHVLPMPEKKLLQSADIRDSHCNKGDDCQVYES